MTAIFVIQAEHIVGEVFDGEAIIIDTLTGSYYSLPEGPAEVWSALASGVETAESIVATSGLAPDVVGGVLAELVAAGLVVTDQASSSLLSSPPTLTKYSDMEELLLLDPIHDVAAAGWPAAPEPDTSSST